MQNQLLQRASAIADYGRKLLFGDREYPPVRLGGVAIVKHAELRTVDVLLHDRIDGRLTDAGLQGFS